MSVSKSVPVIGTAEPTGVAESPPPVLLRKPSSLVNEGPDIPGMRVILAPIKGLTSRKIMLGGDGKPRSFRFQCPPTESFTRSLAYAHADYETIREGMHSRPQGKQLEVIRFQTLIVDWDAQFAVWPNTTKFDRDFGSGPSVTRDEFWNLLNMTEQLEEIMDSGTPVRLYAGQPMLWEGGGGESGWDVNMPVTLRSIGIEERAGEPDARYLDVEFTEYRSLKLNRRRLGKKAKPTRATAKRPAVVEIYPDSRAFEVGTEKRIATSGKATLAFLAKHYFGDPSAAKYIYKANPALTNTTVPFTQPLGPICNRYFFGRSFKLRIPQGHFPVYQDEGSYLNPNSDDYLATIPEESL